MLDAGHAEGLSYFPRGESLGVVLPSNSPGVHSLWAPAFALKTPLVLKPGAAEPWTPYRIIQALIHAGAPPEVFGYYPADHAGAAEILRRCGRGMVFGDVSSTRLWQGDPRIEVHGPGYSKIVIGEDCIGEWEQYLDVMVASILENSGRSCINASGVWVPSHAAEIAEALAARLASCRAARRGRRAGADRAFCQCRAGGADFADDRRRTGWRARATLRRIPPGPRLAHIPRLRVPAADHRAVRFARASAGQPRISVSVRQRGAGEPGRDPARAGAEPGGDRHHARPQADRAAAGLARCGPLEPGRDSHAAHQLGSAARRQPVRSSLRPPGVSVRGMKAAMKILAFTAGAAQMYCGSCIRDNALAAELKSQGHDIILLPIYTPTLTDETNVAAHKVFFGGISVYLEQHSGLFRKTPWLLDRLWDSEWALKLASRRSIPVNPRLLGEMTVSMLRGEDGRQRKEIHKLAAWLRSEPRARYRDAAELAADRPGAAHPRSRGPAGLLHAAGRGPVPQPASGAVSHAVAGADPGATSNTWMASPRSANTMRVTCAATWASPSARCTWCRWA